MISLLPLVQNETVKMLKKRRFLVVILIVAILIPVFTYGQLKVAQNTRKQFGTDDWRVTEQQKISDITNRLSSGRVTEEWKKTLRVELRKSQYALEKNIDPNSPNGVTFTREFMKNSVTLFLPLLIAVVAADIVSSEQSTGTIKILLTRPVRRWKVLMSKFLTLILFVSLITLATGALAYLISGLVFGYGGWTAPVLTGYQFIGGELSTANVHAIEQWQFMLMEFGLAWFSGVVVACMSLMVSVLVRSTAAGIGIMLATLIAGTILANMVSSWETAKYFFMVNIDTIGYLVGSPPPIAGMTITFSLTVLAVWAVVALIVAFRVFTKRDILN
ncbi:ABC transporter permease [Paenibacillus contaminans]|uniref:ABC transporter permease n=1 Tax=Paenibacillus contaminans TaxID=450362 RepID=A0A329MFS7_9BACL|nr:ABC transporter permease [Paenibacillus contaminans]RAV18690.1 ABC transporter permease [Paenibacillus contaminans]